MTNSNLPTVAIAMSGGVDSSTAAALLVEQGYPVIGVMLRLWSPPGCEDSNRCCAPDAMAQARRIAGQLGIPFYALDAQEAFRQTVVQPFIDRYTRGETPNPCILCNRDMRWTYLLERAIGLGADVLASGHYARTRLLEDGTTQLLRGIDPAKDQSYMLSGLSQAQVARAMFPLGEFHKPRVREMARRFNLPVAERPDSQDLCFLGNSDYRAFLMQMAPESLSPGEIVTREGQVVGQHEGMPAYTIGQRKGLRLSRPEPYYVLEKDASANRLVVGLEAELGQDRLWAGEVNWIGEPPALDAPVEIEARIRYKAKDAPARVTRRADGRVEVDFGKKLRDITPGQRVVFYDGEICLGGGTIQA